MFANFDKQVNFKKGDIVSLKSGSCNLIIESFTSDNKLANVIWFTENDECRREFLPIYLLDLENE